MRLVLVYVPLLLLLLLPLPLTNAMIRCYVATSPQAEMPTCRGSAAALAPRLLPSPDCARSCCHRHCCHRNCYHRHCCNRHCCRGPCFRGVAPGSRTGQAAAFPALSADVSLNPRPRPTPGLQHPRLLLGHSRCGGAQQPQQQQPQQQQQCLKCMYTCKSSCDCRTHVVAARSSASRSSRLTGIAMDSRI